MYVDNAVFKMAAEAVRQDGHKACEHDQTDVCVLQQSGKRLAVLFRVGKSLRRSTSEGIAAFAARSSAYAFGLDETTSEICPFSILPACCASMSACRFVPPPETKTAILSFIFLLSRHNNHKFHKSNHLFHDFSSLKIHKNQLKNL